MLNHLSERDWEILIKRIELGLCTPFIGAGACYGALPLGGDIAKMWAKKHSYPLKDYDDLSRVAQFLAVKFDPMFPKEELLEELFNVDTAKFTSPDFTIPEEPHSFLADLPLPIYITTNYDDFMIKALQAKNKKPYKEVCRWNKYLERKFRDQPYIFDKEVNISSANPVVFYLHGHQGIPESLVLTEDDYLDFLVNISKDPELIPARIQEALAGTSLLFVGYKLADWDFKVLFRGLISSTEESLRRISVTVQLSPESKSESTQEDVQKYLNDYFGAKRIQVYWGTAQEFMTELKLQRDNFLAKMGKNKF